MKKYMKLVIGIIVFLALIIGTQSLYKIISKEYEMDEKLVTDNEKENQKASENEAESEADLAPNFTVIDGNDKERTLDSFIGKPVVLNFWASWCPPCKGEFPDFQTTYEKYGSEVEFVMVNLTDGVRETKDTAADFIDSNGYTLPIYYDSNQSAASAYSIYSIPTTYFIDADGKIATYVKGAIDEVALEEGLSMIQK